MEIKRRKIAQAEIFKTEQKFVTDITEICQDRDEDFRAIGYELVLEFGQKDSEYQKFLQPQRTYHDGRNKATADSRYS